LKTKLLTGLLILFPFLITSLHGEGIKQLNPDSTYTFALFATTGGTYPCFAMDVCPNYQKLWVHINNPGEKVFLGIDMVEAITIKDKGGITIATLSIPTHSSPGYIPYYSMAYAGPNVLNPNGYNPVSFAPGQVGDFSINFGYGYIYIFDVTVIDTTQSTWTPIDGRLWSEDWDLFSGNCDLPLSSFIGKQFIYTDDSIVTSINYNGMRGWNFDVTSTSNGCYPPPMAWDLSARSRQGNHHYAQYKMFVNDPDSLSYPTGTLGMIDPNSITFTSSCTGSVVIGFDVNKAGKVKVNIEVDTASGYQPVDVEIVDSAGTGHNTVTWNGVDGLGNIVPTGTVVWIYLSYINGLTNLALYDVEKQLDGFIIQLVRPTGPPIATYWNDTLLKNKGGILQLTGCYPILPITGCHAWDGDAGGIGLGSQNTVNTWWYASSSTSDTFDYIVSRGIHKPDTLTGPLSVCQNSNGIYQIMPNPLSGADPLGYEWMLTDVSTNTVLFDSTNRGNSLQIPFSLFPVGDKRLKVRGTDTICGNGPFGPGTTGEGLLIHEISVPSVTNNPLSESICTGDSTNISLTSSVPGTIFHWTASLSSGNITGFSDDSGLVINQILINSLSTPGVVTYHITPKVGICSGTTVDYPVTVTPGDSVKVSIIASTNNICAGTLVTFTATPTNPGTTPIYQWKVNGINAGTNSPVFTYIPANGDLVSCILTSSATCTTNNPASSIQYPVSVNPNLPVSVTVAASQNPVCSGNSVTFTATPTNGGLSPTYQWKVNSIGAGTNSPVYSYIPNNGDLVSCILTSSATCTTNNPASSIQYPVTVNPNLPVSITISASANPFCQGSSVTFTATPVNGGVSPTYQWQVNGVNVGTNSPNYTYNPSNGNLVSCILTSSETCTTNNPASSIQYQMTAISGLAAGVTIAAASNPFCPGSSVTFTATPINGGTTPAYQWKVNGVNAGTNSSAFTYNPANGDSIRCVMTSNLGCVTNNPASSQDIIMSGTLAPIVTFTACFDTITTINAKPIKLKGGIPLGGTYSGPGVNSLTGVFNPATAGVGTKTITYSYTNAANCSALAQAHIINYPLSIINCGSPFTDIRDNKVYSTVQIGSQCWMAEDLNYGTEIPVTQDQRDNCIPEKYHNPASSIQHPESVYQWDEVMQYDNTPGDQGFCPPAWHIPTENDWNTLFTNYVNNGFAGSPLKYSGYSGFNALLSGARHIDKSWDFQGFATFFWSSTQESLTKAWSHGMNNPDPSVSIYPSSKSNAFSIRCIHD